MRSPDQEQYKQQPKQQQTLPAGGSDRPWEDYLFMRPLLRRLGDAAFMYKAVPMVLRGCAALTILASLAVFFSAGKMIFELPTISAIFGGIMFQLLYILGVYAVVHVFVIRARDIAQLRPKENYMLPLSAILLKLLGEAYASFVALVALGSGIFVWFTGLKAGVILGPLAQFFPTIGDASFIGGIEIILKGLLIAVASIISTYIVSELITVLSNIANQNSIQDVNGARPRQLPSRPRELGARIGNGS
ncbi:MAG: hypothetical protein ACC635_02695 [Acidiferrobacterales bacterium]